MKRQSPLPTLPSPLVCRLQARRARWLWWWRSRVPALLKRGLDLALVLPALLLLAPLLILVGLLVRLHDGGPALYWQQRVGRDGRVFAFPKFRSMRLHADREHAALAASNQHGSEALTFKMRRDPRVTPIGRLLRRTSIDELPQLWCVLRGEMSLVGPRPALLSEVERYRLQDRERLAVTPGLTCIWQVNGRSEVPFPQQLQMDLDYIRSAGLWADVKLIAKTLPAVIRGRGAY